MPSYVDPNWRKAKKVKGKPDYLARADTRNQNQLKRLQDEGLLQEFLEYKDRPSLIDRAKGFGSGVLDVLQRGEFATAGALSEVVGGDPGISGREAGRAVKRAGTELFSGIGGLKGEKQTFGDVAREEIPEYRRFSKEHPIQAGIADLTSSVLLDPATYTGGFLIKQAGKIIGKGGRAGVNLARKTKIGDEIVDAVGNSLVPRYFLKKGANKVHTGLGEAADNIVWAEEQAAGHIGRGLTRSIASADKILRGKGASKNPQVVRDIIESVMPSGQAINISRKADFEGVSDVANTIRTTLGEMADIEIKGGVLGTPVLDAAGKPTGKLTGVIDNYFPNDPRIVSGRVGGYQGSGRGGGQLLQTTDATQKQKIFRTADELIDWLKVQGVPDSELGEVAADLLQGRISKTVSKLRSKNIVERLTTELGVDLTAKGLPAVFEDVPFGTKNAWDLAKKGEAKGTPIVKPGNTLYMPKGNLGFFKTNIWDSLPKSIKEIIEEGGEISLDNLEFIQDTLTKKGLTGVTTRVKAFQAPKEVVRFLNDYSRRLSEPDTMMNWYDKALNIWKNMAILSPFFHNRNMIGSGAQNYLADMNPLRYANAAMFMKHQRAGNLSAKVMGKTVAEWADEMGKFGIDAGGFVGQQTKATGIPVVGKVFEANRFVGTQVETLNRAALYMDRIQKGKKPLEAALDVKKFHFDYGELTPFEQKVMRRLMPFYSWTRHNVPLQLEMIFKAPDKFRNIAKLKRAVAGAPESGGNPDWWREQGVWEVRNSNSAIQLGLPYTDLNVQSPLDMTGPVKSAINLLQNRDDFTGREISRFKGDLQPLGYAVNAAFPVVKRFGFDINKHLREFLNPATPESKRKAKLQLIKRVIGVGILPQVKNEQDRQKIYQLREALDEFDKYNEAGR